MRHDSARLVLGPALLCSLIVNVSARGGDDAVVPSAEGIRPKVSPNGRYFVDQNGTPVFWLGTTQWQLVRDYNLEDVRTILEKTRKNGFTFAQVMLLGVGDGTKSNIHGEKPWSSVDPLTPNDAYFAYVDAVLRMADQNNVVISLTLYHQGWRKVITEKNAQDLGALAGEPLSGVFRDRLVPAYRRPKRSTFPFSGSWLPACVKATAAPTSSLFEPDPSPYSSSFIHQESWLDFNSDADLEKRRADLSVRDQGLQPQAREARC